MGSLKNMKISEMTVSLIDKMGTDLSVVNAARVSFEKTSEYEVNPETNVERLKESDCKLINYLAKHEHFTPFCHAFLSFRIKAPIFVARQLVKHQVGLSWNEVSRRYVDSEPEFWFPKEWRGKPENAKQGSSGIVELPDDNDDYYIESTINGTLNLYNYLLACDVAPEMARMVLPLNTMTEWIWSGSLLAFIRVCKLRCDGHAQQETQFIGMELYKHLDEHFPNSIQAYFGINVK